jgi:hypothetical protein
MAVTTTSMAIELQQERRRLFRPGLLFDALAHAYIWIWLAIFAVPFLATLFYSLQQVGGGWSLDAYQ